MTEHLRSERFQSGCISGLCSPGDSGYSAQLPEFLMVFRISFCSLCHHVILSPATRLLVKSNWRYNLVTSWGLGILFTYLARTYASTIELKM